MKNVLGLVLLLELLGCNRDNFSKEIPLESKIVVEGWIEEGESPMVILMNSIPINKVIDSSTVLNQVIRSARVTVSDGTQEEVLKLKSNPGTIPPFVYFGSSIIGTTGKSYTLKVSYKNSNIEATTTIPKTVLLKTAKYVKTNPNDTIGYVNITFDDPLGDKNYYSIATRLSKQDSIFTPALYGNLDDVNFSSGSVSLQINRGITLYPKTKFQPYFVDGNTIFIRLRTTDKETFDFWNGWQNEIINGRNPIFPSNTSLKSNIKGGLGIWAGYGQSNIVIFAQKK
jgi:hypothetical protein